MERKTLTGALKDHWETPFPALPAKLQRLVKSHLILATLWDVLGAERRQECARQLDAQHVPMTGDDESAMERGFSKATMERYMELAAQIHARAYQDKVAARKLSNINRKKAQKERRPRDLTALLQLALEDYSGRRLGTRDVIALLWKYEDPDTGQTILRNFPDMEADRDATTQGYYDRNFNVRYLNRKTGKEETRTQGQIATRITNLLRKRKQQG